MLPGKVIGSCLYQEARACRGVDGMFKGYTKQVGDLQTGKLQKHELVCDLMCMGSSLDFGPRTLHARRASPSRALTTVFSYSFMYSNAILLQELKLP